MTDLRKILDEATPGPWRIVPDQEGEPAQCITAGGFDMATAWGGYLRAEADARLIALAPQLAAALIKAEEALIDATAHLVGAESAYREFAKRHQDIRPKAATDPFFTTRVGDFRKAADRARAAYLEISALTGGNDD